MTPLFSKLTNALLSLLLTILLFPSTLLAQSSLPDNQIHVPEFTGSAKELINRIKESEGLIFAYSSEIPLDFEVHFDKSQMDLTSFLQLLFKDQSISFKVKGKKVLLFKKQTTSSRTDDLSQTVRGRIIDIDNKLPLPGATVVILNSNPTIGTVSDPNGSFRIEDVAIGRITLQISYLGYETITMPNLVVNSGKEVVLDVLMNESAADLDEVVIRYSKKGEAINDMALLSTQSISLEETKRYTGGMADPARVVSSYAGVANSPGGSDIIVRGNSPKYLQWRLDGVEISSPYHLDDQNASSGALTALNNSLLATSDFYTGAFSPEYGNVLSSVMDMKLRTGNNEKFEAAFGLGLMGTDVTLEGPIKKGYSGSFLINYRYSTISLLNQIGIINIPGLVNYQDATFKLVLPARKAGTFSIFGLGGLSDFLMKNSIEIPGSTAKDANISKNYDKGSALSNLGVTHTLSLTSRSYLKTSLSYSSKGMSDDLYERYTSASTSDQEIASNTEIPETQMFKSRVNNAAYRSAITYHNKLNARNKFHTGVRYALNTNNYNQDTYNHQKGKLENVTHFNEDISTINTFASWKFKLNKAITLISGIHNMNVLLNRKSTLEPRFAINWQLNNSNAIHLGYGKHSTMENIHNYYTKITQADSSIVQPNKNLDLLKADHYVLGYEKYFSEFFKAKLELYYQHLYNLPVENVDTSYYATINEGVDYRYVALVNEGIGQNYGIELTLERFFDKSYYFLANASIFNSKYKSLEGQWRNTQYNGNYMINLLCGKEFNNLGSKQNKTLAINAKLYMGGGKRYIPLLRDEAGNVCVDPGNNRYWDYNKAYRNRIEDMWQLNFSVSYKINKDCTTHEVFLDIMNLTDNRAKIAEYYDSTQPGNIGYKQQFQIFPNLMYRIYF